MLRFLLRWFWPLLALLAFVVALVMFTSVSVSAQAAVNQPADGPLNASAVSEKIQGARVETIDENTVLLDAEYNDDDGTATVEIFSRVRQTVYVVDGSYVLEGGTVTFESRTIPRNSTVTITMPVKVVRGWIMLSVATEETRGYGVPIDKPLDLLPGSPGSFDAPAAGVGVAFATFLVSTVSWVYYRFWTGGVRHEF